MPDECALCRALKTEPVIFSAKDFAVLRSKNMKGHDKRVLFCTREHVPHATDSRKLAEAVKFGLDFFREPFLVMFGDRASIREHWHVILCDRKLEGETVNVLDERRMEVWP